MTEGKPPTTAAPRCRTCGKAFASDQLDAFGMCPTCRPGDVLPKSIGKFRVVSRLGAGGMGVVYKCAQPDLDRPVAVKVMIAGRHAHAEQLERFQREARAAARLTHPNIVQIYDVGTDGPLHYFVMEYVDGRPLDALIGTPALSVDKAVKIAYLIARALQAAHEHGIIHRDVKPANIVIDHAGRPKLADFGLAKTAADGSLSGAADLIGTPRFMSPEQVFEEPAAVDARTDVYSLGAVLYAMLTGRPPLDGPTIHAVLRALETDDPVPAGSVNPNVPPEIDAVCAKAMAKQPADRYPSASVFADALRSYLVAKLLHKPSEPEPTALPELAAALPPRAPTGVAHAPVKPRPKFRLSLPAAVGSFAVVMLIALIVVVVAGARRDRTPPARTDDGPKLVDPGPTPPKAPEKKAAPVETAPVVRLEGPDAGETVGRARTRLHQLRQSRDATARRELLKAVQDDMTVTAQKPGYRTESLRLRAMALRTAGEHLSAVEDWTAVLAREPNDPAAMVQRLLAAYQFHILYFGPLEDPVVRPNRLDRVRADVFALLERGDGVQKRLAQIIDDLARDEIAEAVRLAEDGFGDAPFESAADMAMVEADALFRAADMAHAEGVAGVEADRAGRYQRRDALATKAGEALRRGLNLDPHHVGLLFLSASAVKRQAQRTVMPGEDGTAALRRMRPEFDEALSRFRAATVPVGPETPTARAVLLAGYGDFGSAIQQVGDALLCRPEVPYLYCLRAWLRLHEFPNEALTSADLDRIQVEATPLFARPPTDFNPYFLRALLQAAAGGWEAAKADLQECRRRLGSDRLPTSVAAFADWYAKAEATQTEYLFATQEMLARLRLPAEMRKRISHDLLGRLKDAKVVQDEGLEAELLKSMRAWTHYRLARYFAEKGDRKGVIEHARGALKLKIGGLNGDTFRKDAVFGPFAGDGEFRKVLGGDIDG